MSAGIEQLTVGFVRMRVLINVRSRIYAFLPGGGPQARRIYAFLPGDGPQASRIYAFLPGDRPQARKNNTLKLAS